ncbi:hypothetical protein niasHT_000354 [Heterodera trifolii]|uniref:Uncharacterized protein n=1 Tax=Heterodera trifolii TaxID=157864 RepID=A0ABD2MDD5_9BILA
MASQISKIILPTLLIFAAAFLLNFGCCQQNESQPTNASPKETLARNASSSSTGFPLNITITTKKEASVATPSTTQEAGIEAATEEAKDDDKLLVILIGIIVAIVLFLVLLVSIVCYMRRGSEKEAPKTVNGQSGGTVTTLRMNGDNADSSSASQSASEPDEGWFVPDKLPNNTMTDLAKLNARLAQRKKQQQAPKQ